MQNSEHKATFNLGLCPQNNCAPSDASSQSPRGADGRSLQPALPQNHLQGAGSPALLGQLAVVQKFKYLISWLRKEESTVPRGHPQGTASAPAASTSTRPSTRHILAKLLARLQALQPNKLLPQPGASCTASLDGILGSKGSEPTDKHLIVALPIQEVDWLLQPCLGPAPCRNWPSSGQAFSSRSGSGDCQGPERAQTCMCVHSHPVHAYRVYTLPEQEHGSDTCSKFVL